MQINKSTLSNLFKGFRTIFLGAYQASVENVLESAVMRTASNTAEEVYHWLGALPGMKKLIDEIKIENVAAHNYTIRNDEYEDTVEVKQSDIEQDKEGIYRPMFEIMGDIARQHDFQEVASLLVNGFDQKCYTGKNFFDTNHEPIKGKTKFSNKTTKKLSAANFRTARQNIRERKNAAGRVMGLGRDLVLYVGPANESLGREILEAERNSQGATNVDRGTARLAVSAELGALNPDAWFLIDVGHPMKPIIVQEEKPTDLLALDNPESDHVFKKHRFLYQAYKRGGYGYGLPELAYGSDGSTAA